ncbi:MAG: peroxide stress protein YaaA [Proteobacteria bacterium]|nr:peroxide stress protein YaaA [Pseudomonadota bacterium]
MFTLLSPAKMLTEGPLVPDVGHSQPHFDKDIAVLSKRTRALSTRSLKKLMKLSDKLAELNHQRFQDFELPFTEANARQAIFSFAGQTYVGFDVKQLGAEDLAYAQDHVGILSGLYGLLRPLDLMQPYRLEMGTKLSNTRGKTLYAFWGTRIADRINELTEGHDDPRILHCASNEYFKSVQKDRLKRAVVTPVFKDVKDGQARTLMMFAKTARGAMARWVVQNRVDRIEGIKDFDTELGYRFVADESDETTYVFSRTQPPPVGR